MSACPPREMLRILKTLDVEAARVEFRRVAAANKFGPPKHAVTGAPVSEDEVILASLHKARLAQPRLFNAREKQISRQWLAQHGYEFPQPPREGWCHG